MTQSFDEKSPQVEPGTLTAFGIRLTSRHGDADVSKPGSDLAFCLLTKNQKQPQVIV
jgi:hypothetical protein